MKNEPTNLELQTSIIEVNSSVISLTEVIQDFATSVDQRFDIVDQRFDCVEADASVLKSDISVLKSDVASIKNQMVTKSYLDDKISDLRGDLVVLVRKEDKKLAAVVDELVKRDVFDEPTAKRIFELEPFAK